MDRESEFIMLDDKTKITLEEYAVEQEKYGNKLLNLQYSFQECLEKNAPNLYKEEGSSAFGRKRDFSFWLGKESYQVVICRTPDYDLQSDNLQ